MQLERHSHIQNPDTIVDWHVHELMHSHPKSKFLVLTDDDLWLADSLSMLQGTRKTCGQNYWGSWPILCRPSSHSTRNGNNMLL